MDPGPTRLRSESFSGRSNVGESHIALLRTSLDKELQAANSEHAIAAIERLLDAGRFGSALERYGDLSDVSDPAVISYLRMSSAIRSDLASLGAAQQLSRTSATDNFMDLFHQIESEETGLFAATGKPLTDAYLQQRITADKDVLKSELQSCPFREAKCRIAR